METVLIAGGTGLIGTHLSPMLRDAGYRVWHLSRTYDPDAAFPAYDWDPSRGRIRKGVLEKCDYVINLAGAGIADRPWTKERKRVITQSRVEGNELFAELFSYLDTPPKAYLTSTGIGFYGDRGEEWLTETSPPGQKGFMPNSCIAWENAVARVADAGILTTIFRLGIVLSNKGGALPKMTSPLKAGIATYFGDGNQWVSWIHFEDICRLFLLALQNPEFRGTFNAVAPEPVRNKELMQKVISVKGKGILLPAPAFALRIALGEMADTILDSTRVSSEKIQQTRFNFKYPELTAALSDLM